MMASLVMEHGLWGMQASVVVAQGPSCFMACGNLPGPGIKPVSPALQGKFLIPGPPGKPGLFLHGKF